MPLSDFLWHANSVSHSLEKEAPLLVFHKMLCTAAVTQPGGGYSLHPSMGLSSVMVSLPIKSERILLGVAFL